MHLAKRWRRAALTAVSRLNDRVQGWIFDPNKLAPTYPESMITRPFPFNAYYGIDEVRQVEEESCRREVTGRGADKRRWRLDAGGRRSGPGR